jgi:hypothetical protein
MNFDKLFESIINSYVVEAVLPRTVVIFPGGFHPFHKGHKSVFENLEKKFPQADSFIAISDYTKERPFTADEKKLIISSTGINTDKVKVVKSPFRAEEILKKYNPKTDKVIFAVSEKERSDPAKSSLFTRVKKDGTPSYFQDYKEGDLQPFEKHAYIVTFPSITFNIGGSMIKRAKQLREMYVSLDDKQKQNLIKSMYDKNHDIIKKIFDERLQASSEENEMNSILQRQDLQDYARYKSGGGNDVFASPPYQVGGNSSVGRMNY